MFGDQSFFGDISFANALAAALQGILQARLEVITNREACPIPAGSSYV
jgi:hypothetical protein